ncbi:Lectin C-type domain protein [Aspergillus clavatus NRRL 1]|uniref:Maintenance of telomere capping protein 6 n=1 Tax=Aspergillus clavatus (strain ATCC 1007 / CBS 513.65 / DSM 816 / NCTC 3887 / NRRL 1 / QM 1276 / 107) TaxID=344612 RepID=A1C6U4_ASPCL|nr:Lectin C-type domain protein [Aspergillus clavatus NRRL 1]EAW14115.1 Lectin C-type domain protein [Aspergillus clavatus NRRL 1]
MGLEYVPDASLVNPTWVAVPLSERDVSGQIPINFVTVPTVSLTAACFGNNVYDASSAEKCVSNLLVLGYRRFLVDVYWSTELRKWTFCPVTIPQNVHVVTLTTTPSPTATASAASGTLTVVAGPSGSPLYQLGPYLCSSNFDLSGLVDIFVDYFRITTSQLNVYTRYLSFNLHVASDAASPNGPAASVPDGQLPSISEHVSSLFEERLSAYIYKPFQLYKDRSNLNDSWYEVDDGYKPITEYFTIHTDSSGTQSTPDGWPCSKYVQLAQERRLFLEYGSVDPQLGTYDLVNDNNVIFPPNYLTSMVPVSSSDNSSSAYGCLYDPGATSVSQVNSSWATSGSMAVSEPLNDPHGLRQMSDLSLNLTACGLSPTLNSTLFNKTADADTEPYQNISLSASWAWALGEPRDALPSGTDDDPPRIDRCAIMDLSLGGRWRATNCSKVRHAACRVGNHPFTWSLSSTPYDYWDAHQNACPKNTSFAIPRTGLENTYLYHYLLDHQGEIMDPTSSDPAKREIWLDFNSLDVASCWVTGGPESSCPYVADPHQLERRAVLVAAIAGIVICIITALTLFVKCNTNRRNSRRGKRVIQGWEYEGVPS